LNRKVAAPVQKTELNGHVDSLRSPCDTLYLLKLALTSPTSRHPSVGIVRLWTKATEFVCLILNSVLPKETVNGVLLYFVWLH
jgi:hypothetical protein